MTKEQFACYRRRLSLTDYGIDYLELARNGKDGKGPAPSRRVESNGESLIVRYSSGKNEKVLTLESRRVELAIALLLENDDDVLEFLSQPPKIEITYRVKSGKIRPITITPDFVVMRRDRVELVEGKTADKMVQLVAKNPGRYRVAGKIRWTSSPAVAAANELGFKFRLWTDAEFTRERIRNLKYLDPFLKLGPNHFSQVKWEPVKDFVLAHPGITLEDLALASGVDGESVIRWMLAHHLIYCDLDKFVLADPANAKIYSTSTVSKAMEAARLPELRWPSVRDGAATQLKPKALNNFTKALLENGAEAFAQVHRRWLVITGKTPADATERTVFNWKRAYKSKGYLGLLSHRHTQGNREPRIPGAIRDMARAIIKKHYLKPPKRTIFTIYLMFRAKCIGANKHISNFRPPSHVWFYDQVKQFSQEKIILSQEGKRAAYPYRYNPKSLDGLWDAHGDYPFMNVHCDHTQLSIFLRSSRTGQRLGKPWLTVLIDATCKMVLALYVSFDPPASDTLMMVLRDCVQRWGRLPFGMVVDNGSEFGSTYFETLTGASGIMVTKRPKAHPKYGNPIENFFGVVESQFIQQLKGSSLILKTPRRSTKSVDPRRRSCWTVGDLFDALEHYCFNLFNKNEHNDLGMEPAAAFEELLTRHGIKDLPTIEFNNEFLIQTMPEIDDKEACVQKPCCVQVRGDKFSNSLLSGYLGKKLAVRWDPMDPSRVLVRSREGWIECRSKYGKEVARLSCRDVKFFAQELRARHAATRRNREDINTDKGKFLIQLKEEVEPEIQNRVDKASENFELNNKLMNASAPKPTRSSDAKSRPGAVKKRRASQQEPSALGDPIRPKTPSFL